jgi:TetR/AcrR family transcriptional repressor of lmrAB and yxaGH operons
MDHNGSELSTRERMIRATCELLEAQGYHATGLNEILQRSDTPRGSLYYYFPEGKEELATEAIERQGRMIETYMREFLASVDDAAEAVQALFVRQAEHVTATGCCTSGSITAVALESSTTNERLRQACVQVYEDWRVAVEEKLLASGYSAEDATSLSLVIVGAMEGAIALTRTLRHGAPLLETGEQLARLLRLIQPNSS